MHDIKYLKQIEFVSTGSLNVDFILGIGGLPYGRIVEIYGQESSGKTTFAFSIIKEAQKVGDICAYIDVEHCIDINYIENMGINLKTLLIFQPENGEKVFEISQKLINSKYVKLIVIDSIAAIIPELEIYNNDNYIGSHSRFLSKNLKKIIPLLRKNNVLLLLINQIRIKISNFYNKETSTGGNAVKFYSSIRIELKRIGFLKSKNNIIGQEIKVNILKNKLSKPYRETKIYLIYSYGIYKILEIINFGLKFSLIKIINKKFFFENIFFNNKKHLIKSLMFNKKLLKKIELNIRSMI
ncbi:recombinase RecA [Candidatus Carsonella ruddii]|uniref:Protein RecA n=1 Tax=Candidatus Carsonella ruddii PC isolate NHV TaxID=1202540 RepID=J3YQS7_CARRU|nr:ATPase domain-containing protein [Candidatus Carsonella ruddii]AFP84338.1 RecA recombinase [Candidatus Carsonella ruddii PC isolate NHV]